MIDEQMYLNCLRRESTDGVIEQLMQRDVTVSVLIHPWLSNIWFEISFDKGHPN